MQKWQLTIFLFRNVARIDFINSLSGGTSPSCFFAFTRTSNKTIDTTHKTESPKTVGTIQWQQEQTLK